MKVLAVVEDEPDIRFTVRMTLRADPRLEIVAEAASAEEAIEVASTIQPGLIILDNKLEGEMTGLEATPMLCRAAPNAKILLFSAYDLEREAEEEPGVDAYVRKDDLEELLPTVQRVLFPEPLQSGG